MRTLAAAFASISLGLAGCTGTWGGGGDAEGGECDPSCVARCRQECTHSADSGGYDDCAAGCTCGCD